MAQEYRKSCIDKMVKQLEKDRSEVEQLYKVHRLKRSALDKIEYSLIGTLSVLGSVTIAAIVHPPAAIGLGIASTICGAALAIVKVMNKKTLIKKEKYHDMDDMINMAIVGISDQISKVLNDDDINMEEMRLITEEYEDYRQKLTTLRNNYIKKEKEVRLSFKEK